MELSSTAARALPVVDARIYPRGGLDVLSKAEVARLRDASSGGMHELLRRCALAVLTSGSASDDPRAARDLYPDFDIQVNQQDRGIRIDLTNAPAMAFVDGEIIRGVAELLFAVVRDLAYMAIELEAQRADLDTSEGITNAVFGQLRNARILQPLDPNLVVCWGGHSISRDEYLYTKQVGYELGLRGLDICTGCGPGAMKGPMKGATIAHAKQRKHNTRYIGVTEPGIIAAESPNPIVNHLVIMPDIEKRLEAFVRIGHGILVFPGGVGTAEEILYLLGILLREENADVPFPLILTGPTIAAPYFEQIDRFIRLTLGDAAASRYEIIVGDPVAVARRMAEGVHAVRAHRKDQKDSYYFNWSVHIPLEYQQPFEPSHEAMAALDLHHGRPAPALAADLRRAFSGIVAGNVKEDGMRRIDEFGPFEIHGDPEIMQALDELLRGFVEQRRMKISGDYRPCYRVVT
ncbi:nucleotide 5'-monophosphate nucleosidase PpnN [Xanthomonas citri]|uniref:nucleotide 5'-monophosphate nucleosidase PpnN n=1 Tax=Xanthomonas citri TaxID=346 RepID=UPI0002C3F760|nr:nucleotide 5'-monophosphate nucleosidase PpnN [Xanthomonas citri]AGI07305.1 Rossmann fold nucleotide-binding protein [Xanthomonas citri subsp. citri Aw12879]AJZ43695.1 putative Rossmann fold nucleotide-binding protein [Xanthomonas citri pv. citri]AJZ48313.1 putative Rossmann fold nucleotide-binding protein [Xanthomonas citri pv. citri]AJZ52931.1 putative Rossmann fold nucleotide-binding protein [Xanthomonas citri pv. citri]AJZ65727.1 putative Rossmann fold nucleotide-binding protein [Xantho